MPEFFEYLLVTVYFTSAFILMVYGLNCYVMIFFFKKGHKQAAGRRKAVLEAFDEYALWNRLPKITTQIPIYNEYNVSERIIRAACNMKYPKGKHEIQVLDDSNDETSDLIDQIIKGLSSSGHDIKVIRRKDRKGFKAGALSYGTASAKGEFIAIFDADFVPPEDYLLKCVPFFLENKNLGLVQARWGHLNRKHSLLTCAQSIGIDGHFMIEQSARNWNGLYMNFNGTAGIFRKQAISDAGGWQWDTLTEDMDLSYRMQFAGWETYYNPDLIVPAEIPEDISAFKSQQFRWAKGSIQTAKKLLPGLLKSRVPLIKKIEAYFHMTHYMVHPLMVILALLALPVMTAIDKGPGPVLFIFIAVALILAMSAPNALYVISQRAAYRGWSSRLLYLPVLVIIGTGIALSNAKAVLEALLGIESSFIRTPKKGDNHLKNYKITLPWSAFFEILFGCYCILSLSFYIGHGKYIIGPFLSIYATGFLYTGCLTLLHASGHKKT